MNKQKYGLWIPLNEYVFNNNYILQIRDSNKYNHFFYLKYILYNGELKKSVKYVKH